MIETRIVTLQRNNGACSPHGNTNRAGTSARGDRAS